MKFEVYCDAPKAPAGTAPVSANGQFAGLSRRELQALAKRRGIKANLKSSAIIRELMKHGDGSTLKKAALNDIENIDPQTMGNRANRQPAKKASLAKMKREQSSSSEKAKRAARMAFEREKAERMKKLMAAHPGAKELHNRKSQQTQCPKQPLMDASTQTAEAKSKAVDMASVRKSMAQYVVFDAIHAGSAQARATICSREQASEEEDSIRRIRETLAKAQLALKQQDKLKAQLSKVRESRKQFQRASTSSIVSTPAAKAADTTRRAMTLPAQLGTSEKENVTPGCKVPVCKSSLYYSGKRRSGRTPLADISRREIHTPSSHIKLRVTRT